MRFGLNLPHTGGNATGDVTANLATAARTAESLGFDALFVGDHVVYPSALGSRYPHRPDGRFILSDGGRILEPLSVLNYVAALTSRIKIGTALLVLPYRNPVVVAKEVATLDVLSRGRVILGVGPGWMAEEFEALGVPFERRGAITDEAIDVIRELWTAEVPSFSGEFTSFTDVLFEPRPVQRPAPPIWIGGQSKPAIRRVVRRGDGWLAVVHSPEEYRACLDQFLEMADKAQRDPAEVTLAVSPRGKSVVETIDDIPAYQELGAEMMWIAYGHHTKSFAEMHESMHVFAERAGLTPDTGKPAEGSAA
ncbi:LLM class F420-dependent oxidoreductase [Actinomadura physcomitrii]|nr:LLM class F420-dependent oxidoreductase [Actinomadura physcomitrii]